MAKAHSAHSRLRPPRPLRIKLLHNLLKTQTIRPQEARGTAVQDGLTLIECLVAMIIITIVVAIITPPIFLAVGTRVNNRRTEQALQVAQGEIERVRLLMISNLSFQDIKDSLPPESPGASPTALQGVAAATTVCADGPPQPPALVRQRCTKFRAAICTFRLFEMQGRPCHEQLLEPHRTKSSRLTWVSAFTAKRLSTRLEQHPKEHFRSKKVRSTLQVVRSREEQNPW